MRLVIVRGLAIAALIAGVLAIGSANANVFTHILREAGEAGGKASSHSLSHLGPVGKAAAHLKSLANAPKAALAAHATPEGHWQFVNRDGEVFTAGTSEEISRVLPTLAPEAVAAGESKLSLYVSQDSIFQNRAALDALPSDTDLHVVTDSGSFALTRTGSGADAVLRAAIKPNLIAKLDNGDLFDEAMSYLGRPLNSSNIRTLAIEPGAAKSLSSAPKIDAASKVPLVDQIEPSFLASAFASIRGQTALVVGRVEGGKLIVSPSTGGELSRDLTELVEAARRNDVNLVVLHTDAARQPGGRNWLWQSVEVGGLDDAMKTATFGDFLDALAARRGGFEITAAHDGGGRVHLAAVPSQPTAGISEDASSLLGDVVSHVTGEFVSAAVDVYGRDQSTQMEYDGRLIPGIPVAIQIPYLLSLVAGVLAWPTVRGWWCRLWPPQPAKTGHGRIARVISSIPREAVFWLVFLPLTGIPAIIWQLAVQSWQTATAPFRWLHRRFLRREV
ncbi:MAG: hypothetical protein IPL91_13680 [Hyphomicrobium sp.]|nr:hypothetical protein [Hyphomicrobium sp.]